MARLLPTLAPRTPHGHQELIEARAVPQQRRPTKKLYSLTPAGYERIRTFTRKQPKPIAIRDAIAKRIHWAPDKLAGLECLRARMLGDGSEKQHLAEPTRSAPTARCCVTSPSNKRTSAGRNKP
jgi:hypothetical protein